ncbi:MAG: hypothetical protein KAI24_04805, partial [Planctomycetes bacterium]|nr:hypothetical protein [Planctomycetota bacterium]
LERHADQPDANPRSRRRRLDGMARFARAFAPGGLAAGSDVAPLADRYLTALATAPQQAWITQLLRWHVQEPQYHVDLQLREFEVDRAGFEALVAPLLSDSRPSTEPSAQQPATAALDAKAANALVASLQQRDGCAAGPSPRALLEPFAGWSLELGQHLGYVKDYHVEVQAASVTARPIHATVFDGLRLEAVCARLTDGRCGVALELTRSEVEQPFAKFETTIGVDKKVSIDLPSVASQRSTPTLRIDDGGAVVFAIEHEERRAWHVYVVRCRTR